MDKTKPASWARFQCVIDCYLAYLDQKISINLGFNVATTGYTVDPEIHLALHGTPTATVILDVFSADPLERIDLYVISDNPPDPGSGFLLGSDIDGSDGWSITFDPALAGANLWSGALVAEAHFTGHDLEVDGDAAVIYATRFPDVVDEAPPLCELSSMTSSSIAVTTQDTSSGLSSIQVLEATNAEVHVPTFSSGTTSPITVTAIKENLSQSARVRLGITDRAGNNTLCDPVMTTVIRNTAKPVTDTYTHLPQEESSITLLNGVPGLQKLDIIVNGTSFRLKDLADGEMKTIEVSSVMQPGENNIISFRTTGSPGGSAAILIWGGNK